MSLRMAETSRMAVRTKGQEKGAVGMLLRVRCALSSTNVEYAAPRLVHGVRYGGEGARGM
eukprot:268078-Rhodomonas_salina.1